MFVPQVGEIWEQSDYPNYTEFEALCYTSLAC